MPPPSLSRFSQNRRNTSQRLELMKYNPYLRKHTLHRELKK
jgi:large subunit ribosomal protein L33